MTDYGYHQRGKVSFKSLDSESMAAARAAADAAGLSLEEWLSRTILKNAAKLGIEPGQHRHAQGPGHGTDEEARQDAQRSLEAIARHLEDAQKAADAAGVSVAEWLSRAIMRSTRDGHEAMTRYAQQRMYMGEGYVATPDSSDELDSERHDAEPVRDDLVTPDSELSEEPLPAEPDESWLGSADDTWPGSPEAAEMAAPEETEAAAYTEETEETDAAEEAEATAEIAAATEAEAAEEPQEAEEIYAAGEIDAAEVVEAAEVTDEMDAGDAAEAPDEAERPEPPPAWLTGEVPSAETDAAEAETSATEDEMRAAEIVTRSREEPDDTEQARDSAQINDDTLDLTTPAPPLARRDTIFSSGEEAQTGRRRWMSWLWATLLILLAMLAAAIWILPNMDELGVSEMIGIEESGTAPEREAPDSSAGDAADAGDATSGGEAGADAARDEEQAAAEPDRGAASPGEDAEEDAGTAENLAELSPDQFPQPPEDNTAWYHHAADAGNADAKYVLGTLYLQGKGVSQNFERAATLFRQSADEGNVARAQYALGVLYERGLGVEQNALEALIMFQNAADQGYVLALTKVGEAYLHGRGIGQDYEQAQRYFERAAEAGEANAQYALGRIHELGLGVEQDMVEALKWFTLAAERDHGEAASRVEEIVPQMTREERDRAADLVVEHNRRFGRRNGGSGRN